MYSSGNGKELPPKMADMGFNDYIASVDCLIMGRNCMQAIAYMNLSDEQWPYGDIKIIVLSRTLKEVPNSLKGRVELYSGDLQELIFSLEGDGFKHAYIDGGATIQSFINLQLIDEMILTQVPLLLGEGIPLFSNRMMDNSSQPIHLENAEAVVFENDYIQLKYKVRY